MSPDPNQQPPTRQDLARYDRQMRYPPISEEGQIRLAASQVLICGCGALGSVLANTLARAGVGKLRLVDRDFLELNNLQRQVLYDEKDVERTIPKAVAAREKLERINSDIEVEAHVVDVSAENIGALAEGVDLILDGTDNFETRFLINDLCIQRQLPWIYGGCIGAEGQSISIVPGKTGCLRCVLPEPPPPGTTPTCDTAGILGPIINVIASIQSCEALKILSGNSDAISRHWTIIDLWDNHIRQVSLESLPAGTDCPACGRGELSWLDGSRGSRTAVLCGRNAVQLSFPARDPVSLAALEKKLEGMGRISRNDFLLRLTTSDYLVTVFPDGRAIIGGTEDVSEARTVYAKYIGN